MNCDPVIEEQKEAYAGSSSYIQYFNRVQETVIWMITLMSLRCHPQRNAGQHWIPDYGNASTWRSSAAKSPVGPI